MQPTTAHGPVHGSRKWRVDPVFEIDSQTVSFTDILLGSGRSTVQSWSPKVIQRYQIYAGALLRKRRYWLVV